MQDIFNIPHTKPLIFSTNGGIKNDASNLKNNTGLDTLAQGRNFTISKPRQLNKKQWAKYISENVSTSLATANKNSPLNKSYWNTFHCNSVISFDENGKGTSSYCKNRWCYTCNRIRTAVLIKGYLPQLEKFKDAHFVTLTRPTCNADELENRIDEMQKTLSKINDDARKNKYFKSIKNTDSEYKGLRKLEVTTRPNDKYHPHYHLIVNTKEQADFIVSQWLKKNKDADAKAQDVRKADERSHKELFKYFTKLNEGKRKANEPLKLNYKRLDVIFQAMKGKQVFKSFGSLKMIKEEFNDEDLEATTNLGNEYANQLFVWINEDWINQDSGEMLIGREIPQKVKDLLPKKAIEKEIIEQINYVKPIKEVINVNDAFDLDINPIHFNCNEIKTINKLIRVQEAYTFLKLKECKVKLYNKTNVNQTSLNLLE